MKYAIVLPDGAADEPLPQLSGCTPLESASIPHMDWVAQSGQQGLVVTVPPGFTPGTDVGTLSLFGYDPHRYYSGRAPLEANAKGLKTSPDQLIFRCNFVTIQDGLMKDFTAGHIAQAEADELIQDLNRLVFPGETCAFHTGVSYRNLLLLSSAAEMKLKCAPPHDITDQAVASYWPSGLGAERVMAMMEKASDWLSDHPVNKRRRRQGREPVTHIWLWGQGQPVQMESFESRFSVKGKAITAVDIIRGIALGVGMELVEVQGATGYIDTDYDAKGRAVVEALKTTDLVVVHVEAPDEAGHLGNAQEKVKALERIDQAVVGPLLSALKSYGEWRILIAPDHPTPVTTKAHSAAPPPFCYAGTGIAKGHSLSFTEENARRCGVFIEQGHTLINRLFAF